jgi:hypothetical protein
MHYRQAGSLTNFTLFSTWCRHLLVTPTFFSLNFTWLLTSILSLAQVPAYKLDATSEQNGLGVSFNWATQCASVLRTETLDHTARSFPVDACVVLDGVDTCTKGCATLYVYRADVLVHSTARLNFPVSGTYMLGTQC